MMRTALLLAVLAAGAALRYGQATRAYVDPAVAGDSSGAPEGYYEMGRALHESGSLSDRRYGRPQPSAYRSILYPAFIATAGPDAASVYRAQALLGALTILLVYVLGWTCHSHTAGLAAAALFAFDALQIERVNLLYLESFYAFLVACAALAVTRWARDPDDGKAALAGLALGLTLLCRSALFAFPPLLAFWAWRRGGRWARPRALALLVACSYLPLAPWVARNAWMFKEFVPFERQAAATNMFTGSLGLVQITTDAEAFALAEQTRPGPYAGLDERNAALTELAFENVRSQPGRYVWSVLRRLLFEFEGAARGLGTAGLLLALISVVALRREPAVAALALLWGYFFAVHSTMSVSWRYLIPLMPLLQVLAAAALAEALKPLAGFHRLFVPLRPELPRALRGGVWAAGGVCGALFVLSVAYLAGEVVALPAGSGLTLAADPSKLASDRAVTLFQAGRKEEAHRELERAIALDRCNIDAPMSLGALLEDRGDTTGARRAYDAAEAAARVCARDPYIKAAQDARAALRKR